jgi:hypothetical protein
VDLPVTLRPRPSPTLALALFSAHGAVAAGLAASGLSVSLLLPAMAALAVSLAVSLWRHVVRTPVVALTLKSDGTLDVCCRDGRSGCVQVDPRTTVFPWLVVLSARLGDRRLALALPPDALGRNAHRQLRLWLSWKASAAAA